VGHVLNRPTPHREAPAQLLRDSAWQMSFGERAALEGLLSQLSPGLAIEIGTAEGGSLTRIAAHSQEVHAFDLTPPDAAARELPNVTLHTGDSHKLLPRLLAELSDAGRGVDFVLVDGDHSTEGVQRDMEDLLSSAAVARTVIVMHDSMNPVVRAGLERVQYESYPKVAHVDLDFVAGYMFREPTLIHELWGGLALVVVDSARAAYFGDRVVQERYYPAYDLISIARDHVMAAEAATPAPADEVTALREELARTQGWLTDVKASPSWRITAPLRAAKRAVRRSTG
jgi:hypothetical protein